MPRWDVRGMSDVLRIRFQRRPWDLYIATVYTLLVAAWFLLAGIGNVVSVLLILFFPGYVVVAALFPGKKEIDWTERVAMSAGLSIAIVPLLGLLLNFTPWGIRLVPIIVTLALFTVGVGGVAYRRRIQLPPEQRLSATLDLVLPSWEQYSLLDKGLAIAFAASIVVASGTLAYVVLNPRPAETFTEFYILGPGGNASGYPTTVNVSQAGTVILGVANHESRSVNYTIRIDLVGVQIVFNATSGFNESVEVNRTTWSTFNITLADGQNWKQPYTFRISVSGPWKIQFLLFKDANLNSAYRELHLFVRVR